MTGPPSPARVGAVFGALLVPSFVALGAPTVALPAVAGGLHVPLGETSWVLTAWALMSAVAMPLFGALSGRIGLRASVIAGVALVAAGSLVAASAQGFAVLVAGRAVGGAGAGAMVVAAYSTVNERLPGPDRARALGIVAATGAAASGSGALLGGLFTSWSGWRLVVALPAAAVAVLVPAARLAPSHRDPTTRVDVVGAVLLTGAGAAVVVLLQAPSTGLPPAELVALAVLGVAAVAALRRHVRRRPEGFVPERVLRAPGFLSAGVVGMTVFAAYYAALFAVPALLHSAGGLGAVAVGAALLPAAAFSVLGGRAAPVLARRSSAGTVAVGLAVVAVAGVLVAALLPGTVLRVTGLGLAAGAFAGGQAVLIGLVPRLVEARDAHTAQGLFDFVIYGGSSVGPALVGGLSSALALDRALLLAAALPAAGVAAALCLRRRLAGAAAPPGGTPAAARA